MSELVRSIIIFFSKPIGTILLSAVVSIITAVTTNQITDLIHIKRRKREKLSEISRAYVNESIVLHKEFRDRVYYSDSPVATQMANYSSSSAFKQKIIDDNELYKLLDRFSIDSSGLMNTIQRYENAVANSSEDDFVFVDEIKEEFLKIDKQI